MIIHIKPLRLPLEAMQFKGSNVNECLAFMGCELTATNPYWGLLRVGKDEAEVGDYIVKQSSHFTVIPKKVFEEEWEKV